MLIKRNRVPLRSMLTVGLLPSSLKVAYYRLRGHRIGKGVRIGPLSVVVGREVSIGEGSSIGFGTILRGRKIRIGRHVRIGSMVFFDVHSFEIDDDAKVNEQVYAGGPMLPESFLRLGKRTIVMQFSFLNPTKPLVVGDDTGIGGHCLLFTHGSWQPQTDGYPVAFAPITLGQNVWLPWRVFIMPGVTVGEGTTIGANSLVTKDLPAHCLAAGAPAKVLRGPDGYPTEPDLLEKDRMLRVIFNEFKGYLTDEGLTIMSEDTDSGFRWRITKASRDSGTLEYFSSDAGRLDSAAKGKVVLVLGPVADSVAREAAGRGGMIIDLLQRRRWGSTDAGEEAALFLSRYGLRFNRED